MNMDYVKIEDLEVSVRVYNALKNANYKYAWQIRRMPDQRLIRMPNFGAVSLRELRSLVPYELRGNELPLTSNYSGDIEGTHTHSRFHVAPGTPTDWIDVIAGNEHRQEASNG